MYPFMQLEYKTLRIAVKAAKHLLDKAEGRDSTYPPHPLLPCMLSSYLNYQERGKFGQDYVGQKS